jgi:predicted amidohydrolase
LECSEVASIGKTVAVVTLVKAVTAVTMSVPAVRTPKAMAELIALTMSTLAVINAVAVITANAVFVKEQIKLE